MQRNSVKNIPYIIAYSSGLILILLAAVFYRQPLLSVFFVLLTAMIPLSIFILRYSIRYLSFDISTDMARYVLPCTINVRLKVKNPLLFPLLNCQLNYSFENMYYPCERINELSFAMEGRCDKTVTIPVVVTKAGMFVLKCDGIFLTDMLHFVTIKIVFDKNLRSPVFPEETRISVPKLSSGLQDEEETVWTDEGNMTSDIRQFREYRAGDRIRDIHWKLTAFRDEIIVKEYEKGKEFYHVLCPILDTDRLQDTVTTFYALCRYILNLGMIAKCMINDPDNGEYGLFPLIDEDDLEEIMLRLFKIPVYQIPDKTDRIHAGSVTDESRLVCIHGKDITVPSV